MKHRLISFLIILGSLLVGLKSTGVVAQESATNDDIKNRCQQAQNYLKNIQKPRDLRSRVDRLQAYRYIYHRLDNFVVRLERNKQPEAADLRANMERFSELIEQFKNDYESYDVTREDVARLKDCSTNVVSFSDALSQARAARAKVGEDVQLIQSVLEANIKSDMESLYQQLLTSGGSGAQS